MKFTIDKNILLSKLQLLVKAIPSRSTLPIISSALFCVVKNKLLLRSTDLEISINLSCDITNAEEGSIAIPLSKLLEITSVMPNNEIKFEISDIGKVNLYCGLGKYTIMGQTSEEFPSEQSIENSKKINILSDELKNIIESTAYAVSKDDLKPVLQGILFQIKKNNFITVSTDGHRLVKLENTKLEFLNYTGDVVVPIKFLKLLYTQLNIDEKIIILIGDNHIQIQFNNTIITSRIIKDPYPDYEGVIPQDNTKTLIVNKNEFYEAVKRVSIFSNKTSKQVALNITENNITIITEDSENITTGKETLDCEYSGEAMTIGYNATYLKEVLQHQNSEEIKILLKSPLSAALFLPIGKNDNYEKTTLLMPIRLND